MSIVPEEFPKLSNRREYPLQNFALRSSNHMYETALDNENLSIQPQNILPYFGVPRIPMLFG